VIHATSDQLVWCRVPAPSSLSVKRASRPTLAYGTPFAESSCGRRRQTDVIARCACALTSVRRVPASSSLSVKRASRPTLAYGTPFAESSCSRRRQTDVIARCRTVEVTIHRSHPFAAEEQDRSPLRRFRGRMASPVSIWAAASGENRAGWTLSSFLLADGDPGEVIGLIDEESALADILAETTTVTVNLLGWDQRALADAFAGVAPAPGGPFAQASWTDTEWGPVLAESLGWIGARMRSDPDHAGWGLLLRAVVERVEIHAPPTADLLCYVRGRYRSLTL
jgi:flavin reductase (DIM6/NTAB) family NADH-FMN oxidoreductase RutF